MGSPKGINDLPDEMLIEIFAYVRFEDLVHSVQYVTSRWQEVSHCALLWKHLPYRPSSCESDGEVVSVLQQTPGLQTLILRLRLVQSSVLNTFIEGCPNLKRLEFNKYQTLHTSELKRILQKCPNIEYFIVPSTVLHTKSQVEIVGQFINLHVLGIGSYTHTDNPMFLRPLAEGCPALHTLDLRDRTFTYDDLEYLLQKKKTQLHSLCFKCSSEEGKCTLPLLPTCQTLEALHVMHCGNNVEAEIKSLQTLKTVTTLSLSFLHADVNINNVTSIFQNKAMMQLVELHICYYESYERRLAETIVMNCPHLEHLCFEECNTLTDDSVKNFHTLKYLHKLELIGSNLTDKGVVHISKCKHLKYLNLRQCIKLAEKSMELITTFAELQDLILDFCNIRGLPISAIPARLKKLRTLSVNCCKNMDQEAMKLLKEQMPLLCIHDYVHIRHTSVDTEN